MQGPTGSCKNGHAAAPKMATAKKKAPATVEKKTPYQGPNRCRGYFACENRHTWDSAFSWANYGQRCKKCVDKKVKEGLSESEARAQIQYTLPHSQVRVCEGCRMRDEIKRLT